MANQGNKSAWILVVVIGVALQVLFLLADGKQTATGTAVDFSKAYFMLDEDMETFVCSDLFGEDSESAVEAYLYAMRQEAKMRGFGEEMVRKMIYHVKTETLAQDAESATIRIHGLHRTNIHPVFTYVAKFFQLGHVGEFEETLELVKEEGRWRVCGEPFSLSLEG